MTIVSLAEYREEQQPHWQGLAHCVGCKHEWETVEPIGSNCLECPSCSLPKGYPKYPFGAQVGDTLMTCTPCGSEAFTAYHRSGDLFVKCMGCGADLTESFYA